MRGRRCLSTGGRRRDDEGDGEAAGGQGGLRRSGGPVPQRLSAGLCGDGSEHPQSSQGGAEPGLVGGAVPACSGVAGLPGGEGSGVAGLRGGEGSSVAGLRGDGSSVDRRPRIEGEAMMGWKVLTDDWQSPIQGGVVVADGKLPYDLPVVTVNRGGRECAAGWNFCEQPETALRIAGLWPNGKPCRLIEVDTGLRQVTRVADKCRVGGGVLTREASAEEFRGAVFALSEPFGEHQEAMVTAQLAWYEALGRPLRKPRSTAAVTTGLRAALKTRGLAWSLQQYWADRKSV